jgi:hypothetical protein
VTDDKSKTILTTVASTFLATLIVSTLAWGWKLEGRLSKLETQDNVVQRVKNLEDSLMPVLIEYRLRQELKARGIDESVLKRPETPITTAPPVATPITLGSLPALLEEPIKNAKNVRELQSAVEQDVRNKMVQQRPISKD